MSCLFEFEASDNDLLQTVEWFDRFGGLVNAASYLRIDDKIIVTGGNLASGA